MTVDEKITANFKKAYLHLVSLEKVRFQRDFAKALGVEEVTISQVLNRKSATKRYVSNEMLYQIRIKYKVSAEFLLTGKGEILLK